MRRRTLEVWEGGEVVGGVDNEKLTWRLRGGGSRRGVVGTVRCGGSNQRNGLSSRRSAWNSPEVINIIARKDICGRMWANSVHTCIVTWSGEVDGIRRGCRERWSYVGGGDEEGAEGCSPSGATVTRGWREGGRAWMEEGKGWTAGQTKPLLLHFCPSGQTPTLYTRALPSYARRHPCPMRDGLVPLSFVNVPRRTRLSAQYFSSLLINGTADSKNAL